MTWAKLAYFEDSSGGWFANLPVDEPMPKFIHTPCARQPDLVEVWKLVAGPELMFGVPDHPGGAEVGRYEYRHQIQSLAIGARYKMGWKPKFTNR